MPQPLLSTVHVDQVSTQFSIAYSQANENLHFARRIFPTVKVDKKTGKYFVFDKASFLRNEAQRRAIGTSPARGGYTLTTADYACQEWAYAHEVPDEIRSQADFDTDKAAAEFVTNKLMIAEDVEFASTYLTTGKWATDLTVTNKWNEPGSTPRNEIITGMRTVQKSTGLKPNVMVVGPYVADALLEHADFRSLMSDNVDRLVTLEFIARSLGLESVIEASSVYATSAEGATTAMDHVVGKVALLAHVAKTPALLTPTAGMILSWGEFDGVAANGAVAIKRYRDADEGKGVEVFDGRAFADMVLAASDLGYFFSAAVS